MRSTLSLFCGGLKWNGLYRLSRKIPVFRRLYRIMRLTVLWLHVLMIQGRFVQRNKKSGQGIRIFVLCAASFRLVCQNVDDFAFGFGRGDFDFAFVFFAAVGVAFGHFFAVKRQNRRRVSRFDRVPNRRSRKARGRQDGRVRRFAGRRTWIQYGRGSVCPNRAAYRR